MKTASLPRLFTSSAGALLMAASLGMFISVWAGTGLIHPHDPLFGMTMPKFFCIVGGLELLIALICLFGKQATLQVVLVLWLAVSFTIYETGLWAVGISGGFKGYFGDVSAAFGISGSTADMMLKALVVYLFTSSLLSLPWPWIKKESGEPQGSYLKTSCPACDGHIAFPAHAVGQKIPCPHCKMNITLKQPA